jgi:ATP-dependent protease Clp ATPase subunit
MRRQKTNCSFCGKSAEDVRTLIASPNVFIYSQCVGCCNEILRRESKPRRWLHSLLRRSGDGGFPQTWDQNRNFAS